MPKLDVNQVTLDLNLLIEKYPALMDDKTSSSVLSLLRLNTDKVENDKIKEILKISIDSSKGMVYRIGITKVHSINITY